MVRHRVQLWGCSRLAGRVTGIVAGGAAIVFAVPTALLHMIDRLTTASHASARVISVVLIDADTARRATIAAGFCAAGCQVVEVATQLEAIVHDHPSSMLVTIGSELLDPAGVYNWLSDTTTTADVPARIRELLFASRGR